MNARKILAPGSAVFMAWMVAASAVAQKPDAAQARQELAELHKQAEPFLKLFSKAAEVIQPSVVTICTKQRVLRERSRKMYPVPRPEGVPRDAPFIVVPETPLFPREGIGAGVVVAENGLILTNHHLIEGFNDNEITVADREDKRYGVTVIGRDAKTNLALMQARDLHLPAAVLGDSDAVKVGEWVVAIGSPLGWPHSVTAGIISAKGRRNVRPTQVPFAVEDYIQVHSAIIGFGSAGSPLVNLRGEVIGICSALASQTESFEGLGFAIPSNLAKKVMDSLKAKGKVVRGYLGIEIADINDTLADRLNKRDEKALREEAGLKPAEGVFVFGVGSDSPAEKAGLQSGDVILEIDGTKMAQAQELAATVRELEVGKKVKVVVWRDKAQKALDVTIGEQPEVLATPKRVRDEKEVNMIFDSLGLSVQGVRSIPAPEPGQAALRGVVVTEVRAGGRAEKAGLKTGDLITKVGVRDVTNVAEFTEAVIPAEVKGRVTLYIRTDGKGRFVTIEQNAEKRQP